MFSVKDLDNEHRPLISRYLTNRHMVLRGRLERRAYGSGTVLQIECPFCEHKHVYDWETGDTRTKAVQGCRVQTWNKADPYTPQPAFTWRVGPYRKSDDGYILHKIDPITGEYLGAKARKPNRSRRY